MEKEKGTAEITGHSVDVKIVSFSPADKDRRNAGFLGHANFYISIDGINVVEVRGCHVSQRKGKGRLTISMPGRVSGSNNTWKPFVVFVDAAFKQTMTDRLSADLESFLPVQGQAPTEGEVL